METTVAVIGTGNMGGALARGICKSVGPDRVWLANRTREKAEKLAAELGCHVSDNNADAFEIADYTFLCVKPQYIKSVLEEIIAGLPDMYEGRIEHRDRVLVSVAAGLQVGYLTEYVKSLIHQLGFFHPTEPEVPVVRIMPNTCVAIGKGMTAVSTPNPPEDAELFHAVEALLRETGCVKWIDDALMDQFTAVAGCGPAFVYPYIEALADGGVMTGLPRALAVECAAQTVLGAAAMVLEGGKHPGQLKDEVCSPGGSTIAGVAELERGGLRAAAINAVLAAYRRGSELGK